MGMLLPDLIHLFLVFIKKETIVMCIFGQVVRYPFTCLF